MLLKSNNTWTYDNWLDREWKSVSLPFPQHKIHTRVQYHGHQTASVFAPCVSHYLSKFIIFGNLQEKKIMILKHARAANRVALERDTLGRR